jgi:hypothetical protein
MVMLLVAAGCAPQGVDGRPAWEALGRQLPGTWEAENADGQTIKVEYRLISGDSALVEKWIGATGNETMTVVHPDGERLMLTHYCAQQNQARLVATEATGESVTFRLIDATNTLPDRAVLSELVLYLKPGELGRVERYKNSLGDVEEATLTFTRTSTQ